MHRGDRGEASCTEGGDNALIVWHHRLCSSLRPRAISFVQQNGFGAPTSNYEQPASVFSGAPQPSQEESEFIKCVVVFESLGGVGAKLEHLHRSWCRSQGSTLHTDLINVFAQVMASQAGRGDRTTRGGEHSQEGGDDCQGAERG